jgi:PEP-CTERM motif
MRKILGLAVVALIAAASGAQADTITLGYSLGAPSSSPTVISSGSGTDSALAFAAGTFDVTLSGIGSPILPEADLSSNTFTVDNMGTSTGTIYIYVTETGLTTPVAGFITGFSNDSLSSGAVLEQTYADTGAFGQTYLLGSALVNPGAATSDQSTSSPAGLPSTYSLTEVYGVTLAPGKYDDSTLQITSYVPEPLTLSVFGAGLVGAAALRRRKKAKA